MKTESSKIVIKFLHSLDEWFRAGYVPSSLWTRMIELVHNPDRPLRLFALGCVYPSDEDDGDFIVDRQDINDLCLRIDEIAQMARLMTCGQFSSTVGEDLRAALIEEAHTICRKRLERYDRKPKAVKARGCFTPVHEWLRSRYTYRMVHIEVHPSVLDQIAPHHLTGYIRTVNDGWAQCRMFCPAAACLRRDFRRHTRNMKFVG